MHFGAVIFSSIETGHWEVWVFIALALAIPIGSLLPNNWLPPLPNDKLLHFSAYGLLAALGGRMAGTVSDLELWFAGLFVAGMAIEVAQNCLPDRQFCWRDIAANGAGILMAALFSPQLRLLP